MARVGDVIVPYMLKRELGKGGFSSVFEVVNVSTATRRRFAMKIAQGKKAVSYLDKEHAILRLWDETFALMESDDDGDEQPPMLKCCLPAVHWYSWFQNMTGACMVMDLAGADLGGLVAEYKARSQLVATTEILSLGRSIVQVLEQLHHIGYLHNDLKPQNIVAGRKSSHDLSLIRQLYLIDLGLATPIGAPKSEHEGFRGTVAYSSVAGHQMTRTLDARDDIESLMYVLLYVRLQRLPWMEAVYYDKEEKRAYVSRWKQTKAVPTAEECQLPEISHCLRYLWGLENSKELSYEKIHSFLSS